MHAASHQGRSQAGPVAAAKAQRAVSGEAERVVQLLQAGAGNQANPVPRLRADLLQVGLAAPRSHLPNPAEQRKTQHRPQEADESQQVTRAGFHASK